MIKQLVRKLVLREKADSKSFVAYLRKKGVTIGENVRFFSPRNTIVDTTFPWLITMGNNISVTHGVIILTHDYSWSVIKQHPDYRGEILGAMSPVKIGNNVYFGMNAVVTRGVTIGDNVIIGAGSIVTSDCESNSVYAGCPARRIMSIQQFQEKRQKKQLGEARVLALEYRKKYGTKPPREVFWEYFMLFCTAEEASVIPAYRRQMETGGNYDACVSYMNDHVPMFDGFDAFLEFCYAERNTDNRKNITATDFLEKEMVL